MLTLADIILFLSIWFVLLSMHSAGTIIFHIYISYYMIYIYISYISYYMIYSDSNLVLTFRSQYNKYFINNDFVYKGHQKNFTVPLLSQKTT